MAKWQWFVGVGFGLVPGLVACSSSSSGGSGDAGDCLLTMNAEGMSCVSCLQSSCSSELNAYETACSDYVNCYCAADGGVATGECENDLMETNCATGLSTLQMCQTSSCAMQCG